MAKKKTESPANTSTVISDWKRQNEEKLQEIEKTNPALFSGIIQALNYLSGSLGGSAIVQEEKPVEKGTEPQSQQVLSKELLEGTFIRVRDFDQFLLIQGIVMMLGYEYHPMLIPSDWQPDEFEAKYSIKKPFDVNYWAEGRVQTVNPQDRTIVGVYLSKSNDDYYTISVEFKFNEHLLNSTMFREINLLDLGVGQSAIDNMQINFTKAWIPDFGTIHRNFQEFLFNRGVEFPSGKNIQSYDSDKGYIIKDLLIKAVSNNDYDSKFLADDNIPISPRQFNVTIPWVLDDFYRAKCAIFNVKRDLPQIKSFFENIKSLTGGEVTVWVDDAITEDSWCYVDINYKFEVKFWLWESASDFQDLKRKEFRIGDLGLPLIDPAALAKKDFPSLYSKVKLPTTFLGNKFSFDSFKTYFIEITEKANDFGVDWAYVVGIQDVNEPNSYTGNKAYKLSVFTKGSSKYIDEKLEKNQLDEILKMFDKADEYALPFDINDLQPYETSAEVEIGMNIPTKSEKNVSLEDQKTPSEEPIPLTKEFLEDMGFEDLADELDNLEI